MDALSSYLRQTLGRDLHLRSVPLSELDALPSYLRGHFTFWKLRYMGIDCLLAATSRGGTTTADQLQQQLTRLREAFGQVTILVTDHLRPALRNSLTNRRINFIVPGKQLFLPELMISLGERYKAPAPRQKLLPSAQSLLLYWILRRNEHLERMSFREIAQELRYTTMAIGTAVDNLNDTGLCEVKGRRNKRLVFRQDRRDLWLKAQPFLTTPVKRIVHEGPLPPARLLLKANLSAMAEYSSLDEGGERYYAIDLRKYLRETRDSAAGSRGTMAETQHIELWKYDPEILAGPSHAARTIDPLSLCLSLKEEVDERVSKAMDELLGGLPW